MSLVINIEGRTFGKLTALRRSPRNSKAGKARWECQCACGNETTVVGSSLLDRHAQSCGCLRSNGKLAEPGLSGFNIKYNVCRNSARQRNLEFSLSKKQHADIIVQNCYHCNTPPQPYNPYASPSFSKKKYKLLVSTFQRAWINVNGIDRLDNTKGYIAGNCVPCCPKCNWMKSDLNVVDFMDHITKILVESLARGVRG